MRNLTLILVIILNITLFSTFVVSQTTPSASNFTSAANNVTGVACFIVK
ncbi:15945_t:CDS:1, partial [Racocetra persica]